MSAARDSSDGTNAVIISLKRLMNCQEDRAALLLRDFAQLVKDFRYGGFRFASAGIRARRKFFFEPAGFATKLVSVRLPTGQKVNIRPNDSDFETLRQVFRDGQYELFRVGPAFGRLWDRYSHIRSIGRTPLIIDAGANIGAASIWFKSLFPDAVVVAIEPEPRNVAVLRTNLKSLTGVHILEAAVGSRPGFVELSSTKASWAFQTTRAATGTEIVTIAQARNRVNRSDLLIVKVDIEGFEADLFAANVDWLADSYCLVIEPHDWMLPKKGTGASFQRAMPNQNFELFILGENLVYIRQ